MTKLHTTARVDSSGNIVVPVGETEVGREVDVVVESADAVSVSQELWTRVLQETAGSIPELVRPDMGYIDPPPSFDIESEPE